MYLTGILYFKKVFGRKKDKLLYQCIPYNKNENSILVPYKEKENKFSKVKEPLYIVYRKENEKYGIIIETIGSIYKPENYYQYELYSNNLIGSSFSFKNFPKDILYNFPSPLETPPIITIDPEGCKDFDDAISIKTITDKKKEIIIYISNVPLFLEENNLWNYLTERVSTIYLPHKNIPLLPTSLSENYCSLKEGTTRYSFNIHFFIEDNKIIEKKITISPIFIQKNYIYEEEELLSLEIYKEIFRITNSIKEIKDSHELISFWMIETNFYLSELLKEGILRKTEKIDSPYYEYKGLYIDKDEIETRHEVLGLETYTHMTSPIRRIVDLLNLCFLQNDLNLYYFSKKTIEYCKEWKKRIDFINSKVNLIKRVQNRSSWIHLLSLNLNLKEEKGIILEKNENEYLVYFPNQSLFKKYKTCYSYQIGEEYMFRFYYFPQEGEWNRKFRIEPII